MTMRRVDEKLLFGALDDCVGAGEMAVVHACKIPCHQNCIGYTGSLHPDHPHYLSHETGHHLYLNMIDPPLPLFHAETFERFFDFTDRMIETREVLIHCNQGQSRAPSLALLYMAKRLGTLPDESFGAARAAFETKFPYQPGQGIATYLTENWRELGR